MKSVFQRNVGFFLPAEDIANHVLIITSEHTHNMSETNVYNLVTIKHTLHACGHQDMLLFPHTVDGARIRQTYGIIFGQFCFGVHYHHAHHCMQKFPQRCAESLRTISGSQLCVRLPYPGETVLADSALSTLLPCSCRVGHREVVPCLFYRFFSPPCSFG